MSIEVLTKYKQNLIIRNKGQVSEKSVAECSNLTMDEVIDCLDYAIDIMRKYQKIKEIIQHWIDEDLASESPSFADSGTIEDIIEVLEDGNDD